MTYKFQLNLAKLIAHIHAGLLKNSQKDIYTYAEIDNLDIAWDIEIVQELPETGVVRKYYLVEGIGGSKKTGNIYDIYIWINGDGNDRFEKIGQVSFDMRNHYTMNQLTAVLDNYQDADVPFSRNELNFEDDIGFAKIKYENDGSFLISIDENFPSGSSYSLNNPLEATPAEVALLQDDLISKNTWDSSLDGMINMADTAYADEFSLDNYTEPDYTPTFEWVKEMNANNEFIIGE